MGIDSIGLHTYSLLSFLLHQLKNKKGTFVPLMYGNRFVKNDLFDFNSKYTDKIADICNKLQNTHKIYVFLALYLAPFYVLSKSLPSM